MPKDPKSTTWNATRVLDLQRTIDRSYKEIHRLTDQSARAICPVKPGDVFRACTPWTQRPGFFVALSVGGTLDKKAKVINYAIEARRCRKDGTIKNYAPTHVTAEWQPTVVRRMTRKDVAAAAQKIKEALHKGDVGKAPTTTMARASGARSA